jgi:hypothetical protein
LRRHCIQGIFATPVNDLCISERHPQGFRLFATIGSTRRKPEQVGLSPGDVSPF